MQIDGPNTGWFKLDGFTHVYKTYAVGTIEDNPGKLLQMAASHIKFMELSGIVVWRRRPEIKWDEGMGPNDLGLEQYPPHWKLTYRCTIIPEGSIMGPFPFPKEEGEPVHFIT